MSNLSSQSFDHAPNSDMVDNDFENDDLITFQHDSKKINLYYSQLTKYSKHIRESYLFSDVMSRLPQEIHKLEEENQLLPESIDYFFQLLEQNYNMNEDSKMTYIQCVDLLKISKFLEVRKLSSKINQYIKAHNIDVDFIIQMIEYDIKTRTEIENSQIEISNEIENILSIKINECFSNERFDQLPIQIIYRVIKKCVPEQINNNKLFDIIEKSLSKFCVLFQFLDLQKLSEGRLEKLCEMHSKSNENTRHCFDYLKCNLDLINEISNRKKNLQELNDTQQNKVKDLEAKITSLQNQLNDSNNSNIQQQNKMSDLEAKIESLQKQFNEAKKANNQLQNQLKDSKSLNNEQQNKVENLETLLQKQTNDAEKVNHQLQNQIIQLQKQINDLKINGQIVASVEQGIVINAEINLNINSGTLDTYNSKIIISTSDEQYIGREPYDGGEPITSLHMKTSFVRKSGTYYVRCIVFNSSGVSNEIVSNSITTSGNILTFNYKGEPEKISLPKGKYKLEVWGAKGGDSNGIDKCDFSENHRNGQTVEGGLGGYSRGTLNLKKPETIYIYVGEKGRPSDSPEGSSTKGGFPDGGGTKTGHKHTYCPIVPGTGGGSTSIRIGNETDYARVIVAGGGGGASGDHWTINPGGFGGGVNGGNCFFKQSLQSQGAGTQTGSTAGLGENSDRHGDPGKFGYGATNKYIPNNDSGGGGGGGWYGGGSGGAGRGIYCSSGGGGSGWTFTELNFKKWQSGDSENASKFLLNSDYYLTDTICVGGNEEFPSPDGNGNERGHSGNGYAKITVE